MIEVVEYGETWPARAAAARAELVPLGVFGAIEHIGSTSVPGLEAKPIIDLMAAADSLDAVAAAEDALARLGYQRLDVFPPGRLYYYRDEDGPQACHLHVVPTDTFGIRNEQLLRDHLRAGQDRADPGADRPGRADRGLPPVPVWEE